MNHKTYGFASEFASRMEVHQRDAALKRAVVLDDIKRDEILRRHELSGEKYNRASFKKRKAMRGSALSLDLRRWT